MKFKVVGDEVTEFMGKKGRTEVRRLLLMGANGELKEQICEFNLAIDSTEEQLTGETVEIIISMIPGVFMGRARRMGEFKGVVEKA